MSATQITQKKKSKVTRAFLVSLVVVIICSILNWGIITGWGNMEITRVNLVGEGNVEYSALLYVPDNATAETPAPVIAMYHGGSGNARNHESWAIEFARRGFVVISVDNMGGGDSEYVEALGRNVVPELFTEYVLGLPFVDPTRLVLSGHSQGAGAVGDMALLFEPAVSLFSNGGQLQWAEKETAIGGDILMINGEADKTNEQTMYEEVISGLFTLNGTLPEGETVVPGQLYGSFEDNNANMMVVIPGQVHEAAFISSGHIAALLDFTQQAIEVPNPIDANNQVWMWKDVMGLIGMFALAICMILLALTAIDQIPFFATIRQPMPRNIGLRGKDLGISVVCAILFPVLCLYTGAFGLVEFLGGKRSTFDLFSVRLTNYALSTIIALNIFGALMFILYHKVWGKKKFQATLSDYGLAPQGGKFDWKLPAKCLLLAILVIAAGWTYLNIQGDLLGTDFYCLFFGYKPLPMYKLIYYIPYMIVWALCFAVAAVGMNVERRLPSTGNETKDTVIAMVVNIVLAAGTLTAMVFIESAIQLSLGTSATALATWGTDITRLWGMPVGMIIGAGGNTFLYRKTGNIWLGAIMMGFIAALGACLYGQIQF